MTYYEAVEYSACVAAILESKNLDIDYNYGLPCGDTILLNRDLISLTRLPCYVMCDPDYYLNPGDEIFVQCRTLNISFYHSGIYAGRGRVFHFMADCESITFLTFFIHIFSIPRRLSRKCYVCSRESSLR